MDLTVSINLDGAAFEDSGSREIFDILSNLGRAVSFVGSMPAGAAGTLRDSNGNTVGRWGVTDES